MVYLFFELKLIYHSLLLYIIILRCLYRKDKLNMLNNYFIITQINLFTYLIISDYCIY